jgi:hypothetical protein
MKYRNIEKQNITKLTTIIYLLRITDDNYINILRATYTHTHATVHVNQTKQIYTMVFG